MNELWRVSGKKLELPEAHTLKPVKLELRPGGWIVIKTDLEGGGVRQAKFAAHEVKKNLSLQWQGQGVTGEWSVPERGSVAGGAGSDADLIAQFPGKVRKLLVREGQVVAEGDKLVLLEAMKMEFAVHAPFAGVVKKVLVQEGQQLSPGVKLVDLEGLKKD